MIELTSCQGKSLNQRAATDVHFVLRATGADVARGDDARDIRITERALRVAELPPQFEDKVQVCLGYRGNRVLNGLNKS